MDPGDNINGEQMMLLEQFLLLDQKKIKEIYTRVLKGHIAVATAKINKVKNGNNLDKLARKVLNQLI